MCYKHTRVFACGWERYRTVRFCDDAGTDSQGWHVQCRGSIELCVAMGTWCRPRCGRVSNNAGQKCKLHPKNGGWWTWILNGVNGMACGPVWLSFIPTEVQRSHSHSFSPHISTGPISIDTYRYETLMLMKISFTFPRPAGPIFGRSRSRRSHSPFPRPTQDHTVHGAQLWLHYPPLPPVTLDSSRCHIITQRSVEEF